MWASLTGHFVPAQAYLKGWSSLPAGDGFGESVTTSGDGNRVAVGAPCAGNCSGAVFLFERTGTSWSTLVQISAPPSFLATSFGRVVALSGLGGTLAVGASYEDGGSTGINGDPTDNSASGSGAAYVFTRTSSTWTQEAI